MSLIRRIKPLFGTLLGIALLWTGQAIAAGTLPLAMAQQIDINGKPLAGCQVSFFVAGTVASPQNSFSDFSLTQNPSAILSCDQAGRVPMFWLADGLVHVRMTDANGSPVIDTTMQVLGPSSGGGGGGGTVDPTTILASGDLKVKYGTGPLTGFVRANGLTIGNATSGASERANADTQNLFIYLYGADANLVVSGGRTGNALNDYNANKQLTLPDWRGQVIGALADMGNTATSVLTSTFCGASPIVLGAACGNQSVALSLSQLPTGITSNNAAQAISVSSALTYPNVSTFIDSLNQGSGTAVLFWRPNSSAGTAAIASTGSNPISVTSNNTSGAAHPTLPPMRLATIYIKL